MRKKKQRGNSGSKRKISPRDLTLLRRLLKATPVLLFLVVLVVVFGRLGVLHKF